MNQHRKLSSCCLALIAAPQLLADAPVSAGLHNDALKPDYPALDGWDIGGQFRFRYEVKDGAGVLSNNVFVGHGVDNENDWFKDSVGSVPANGGATNAVWACAQVTVNF